MGTLSNPNWKLPNIPLKKLSPKNLQCTLTTLPSVPLPIDIARRDSSLSYLHSKNRLIKSDEALAQKRLNCQVLFKKLKGDWDKLVSSENRFREMVISHSKFVRNNLEKRTRATTRLKLIEQQIQVRQASIDEIKKEIDETRSIMLKFKTQIEKHDIYDVFMTNAVESNESPYKTIYELLKRYEILISVKEKRVIEQVQESTQVIIVHQDMKDMIDSSNVVLIGLRNELNDLSCRFDETFRKNVALETLLITIMNKTNEILGQITSCEYMIEAIYDYICERRGLPLSDLVLSEVEPKIDTIKSTLAAWEEIIKSPALQAHKSALRSARHSQFWRPTLVQSLFMWKKKASMKPQESTISVKKITSHFK
ncbi:uncharacterized protein LOC123682528 [Harmonia axyridis]|uniref:uncharacterized protein LOC123682528 n=1 Tax=Harmonia axyridis TaxID=115357 RepID=UPI001E27680D|nr:uncharacterized protein LOC123682528 [Harmonia axyridis]